MTLDERLSPVELLVGSELPRGHRYCVRVENPHLGDAVHWQGSGLRGDADCLGRGSVDDAEGAPIVRRHERLNPSNAFAPIRTDHRVAATRNGPVSGGTSAEGEGTFDEVTGHGRLRFAGRCANLMACAWHAIRSNRPDCNRRRGWSPRSSTTGWPHVFDQAGPGGPFGLTDLLGAGTRLAQYAINWSSIKWSKLSNTPST